MKCKTLEENKKRIKTLEFRAKQGILRLDTKSITQERKDW